MTEFYKNLPSQFAIDLEYYSQLNYRLRESRKAILTKYDAIDSDDMLQKIKAKEFPEIPCYDHYLSILILEQQQIIARDKLQLLLANKDKI